MAEPKALSYELNTEMLELLRQEFDVEKLAARFAEAAKGKNQKETEEIAKEIFSDYGREWIRRALQLGDEYPDRTYEVLKEAIDYAGGYYKFGLVPQRVLEIAYLSVMDISTLPIVVCNANQLTYRMVNCLTHKSLKEKCGEKVAGALPCKHACLTAVKVLHEDLELDAAVRMDAEMGKDGYCQFSALKA